MTDQPGLYPKLTEFLKASRIDSSKLAIKRLFILTELASAIQVAIERGQTPDLVFICTHNSRRSHIAHLCAEAAARLYAVDVRGYSGGTEATAFNPRAVAALERAGFDIKSGDGENPRCAGTMSSDTAPIDCFSKHYADPPNPTADFMAVMVCDSADEACPHVAGAASRFALPYVDPKHADDTAEESAAYDAAVRQIAGEMLFVMGEAAGHE
ncbi:MAG: protein-tyrosine-phosphatase [Planctomycetota bacterium]